MNKTSLSRRSWKCNWQRVNRRIFQPQGAVTSRCVEWMSGSLHSIGWKGAWSEDKQKKSSIGGFTAWIRTALYENGFTVNTVHTDWRRTQGCLWQAARGVLLTNTKKELCKSDPFFFFFLIYFICIIVNKQCRSLCLSSVSLWKANTERCIVNAV